MTSHSPHSAPQAPKNKWLKRTGLMALLATAGIAGDKFNVGEKVVGLLNQKPPVSLNTPGNMIGVNGVPRTVKTGSTNEYDNGYRAITKTMLVNAAQLKHRDSKTGLSDDARSFDGLWRWLTEDSKLPDKKLGFGTRVQGHFGIKKKTVKDSTGKKMPNDAFSHYEVEAYTNSDDSNEQVIEFSWDTPYDKDEVDKLRKKGYTGPINFRGLNEYRKYGPDGVIQLYTLDNKGQRVGPVNIARDGMIELLRELPGLQAK